MSLFVHERPTVTLMDVLVQIVSELIFNRVDYKTSLGDAPTARAFNTHAMSILAPECPTC